MTPEQQLNIAQEIRIEEKKLVREQELKRSRNKRLINRTVKILVIILLVCTGLTFTLFSPAVFYSIESFFLTLDIPGASVSAGIGAFFLGMGGLICLIFSVAKINDLKNDWYRYEY